MKTRTKGRVALQIGGTFAVAATLICGISAIWANDAAEKSAVFEEKIENVDYCFDFATRRATVRVGNETLEADGFGVEFDWNGAETPPDVDVFCVETAEIGENRQNKAVRGRFEVRPKDGGESKFFELTVDRAPDDGVNSGALRLRFRSDSPGARAVSAGRVRTARRWFRFSTERYAEAYGQPFWPRTAYFPDAKLFFAARWTLDGSAGTRWDENGDRRFSGSGDFEATPRVLIEPNLNGERADVAETLILRVGTDLWETVGRPAQAPSEYFDELKNTVYLDFWSGTAAEVDAFLTKITKMTAGRFRFLTVFQNWEAGGWDALLPDSIRTPDFPPNPEIGTVADIAKLAKTAKDCGRFALRTNYMFVRDASPSFREGAARRALAADGTERWHIRLADVGPILTRQEREIAELFAPNANFSDQLTSGAAPWAYLDFAADAANRDGDSTAGIQIGRILTKERETARRLKAAQNGPLGSESLMDEHLLGEFVDFGDYGIYDGFNRALTPEFKLRRLNRLTAFHGVGLMYRFFELPPFKNYSSFNRNYVEKAELRDDYRAVEILFGNGAYLFYEMNYVNVGEKERVPMNFVATEIALVGTLQRRYVGEEVASVEYWDDGAWRELLELVEKGVEPIVEPWAAQAPAFRRVKVRYRNGLTVVVNRLDDEADAQILAPELATTPFGGRSPVDFATRRLILPKSGWVAWSADGRALAFSGRIERIGGNAQDGENAANGSGRIDFIDDADAGVRYVDPRGREFEGRTTPTLWLDGEIVPGWDEIEWETPEN